MRLIILREKMQHVFGKNLRVRRNQIKCISIEYRYCFNRQVFIKNHSPPLSKDEQTI